MIGFVHFFTMLLTLTIYASLAQIPPSCLRAAADLGASPWQTFLRVTLPLTLPGIVVGAFLTFVLTIGDYITPQILGGNNELLLPQLIMLQIGRRGRLPDGLGAVADPDGGRDARLSRLRPLAPARAGLSAPLVRCWRLRYLAAGLPASSSCRSPCWCCSRSRARPLPVPPFNGPSLRWYATVLADRPAARPRSAIRCWWASLSSLVATALGFLAA